MSRSYPDLDMVVHLAETLHTDPNALLYPPQGKPGKLPGRPVAYKSIVITLLAALMVGCTCVILEELRNAGGSGQDGKGE